MSPENFPTYRKDLVEKARKLRKNSTPGEIELWKLVKNKQVMGYQFRRQRPVKNYIVDFYCKELRLAIEIDGSSHDYKVEYDQKRQEKLEELGITFLRFSEEYTKINPDYVVMEIESWIKSFLLTLPLIPSGGGEAQFIPSEGNKSTDRESLSDPNLRLNNESSSPRERKQRRRS
ncbi:MAG: endonuclease domain-containing protein [Balneola sp.]|jgi:very-short-patch-repair endonuclease